MKNVIRRLCISLAAMLLLSACSRPSLSEHETGIKLSIEENTGSQLLAAGTASESMVSAASDSEELSLPDHIFESYYAGQSDPSFEYFKKKRIQKFLAMWVEEETGDLVNPVSDYDSFTQITVLDHNFEVHFPDRELYCCTFSDGAGRYGYVIIEYLSEGPAVSNWGVRETTPYLYDLRTHEKEIAASLIKTDIDLSTAKASRVYLFDEEKKRADQVILFTDEKGDHYICYFGDDAFEIEKW